MEVFIVTHRVFSALGLSQPSVDGVFYSMEDAKEAAPYDFFDTDIEWWDEWNGSDNHDRRWQIRKWTVRGKITP